MAMMSTSRRHRTNVTGCSLPKSRVFAAAADVSRARANGSAQRDNFNALALSARNHSGR
jgi:hypothetical protein